jgi:hypothetical protein
MPDDQERKLPVMMGKLYGALRVANIPDERLIAAAEEAAEFKDTIADIKSMLRLHAWILTFNTAMIIVVVGRLFLGRH